MQTESLSLLQWDIVFLLTLATLAILFLFFRVEKKARWISLIFLVIPVCSLMYRLSQWRMQIPELRMGLLCGIIMYVIWHLLYGRKIPLPSSDNIKVWGQDD
jgi:predicted membrane channel-forming protein YqfA (hemolysin III family)